jgi:UDP-N-acetylglucosamine:LPS N-acetylglucosamine transferase
LTPQRRIVVAGAGFGGGHESIAEALADALRRHRGAQARVASVDLLERCAPRSARLAAIALRGGEDFFPDTHGTLAGLAARTPDDPLVRELATGGIASAEAILTALEPDLVLAVHPVAGAIAAEVAPRLGFPAMTVIGDLWPTRIWLHPSVSLYFVAGSAARDAIAGRGVEWARVVVSGIPVAEPPARSAARSRLAGSSGLAARFTVFVDVQDGGARIAEELGAGGIQALVRAGANGRTNPRPNVVAAPGDEDTSSLIAASDLVVCSPCGSAMWEAPAASVPLVIVEPVTPMERSSVDLLVTAGGALVARDGPDAARRIAFLEANPERLSSMSRDSGALGHPLAARAVCERALAELR